MLSEFERIFDDPRLFNNQNQSKGVNLKMNQNIVTTLASKLSEDENTLTAYYPLPGVDKSEISVRVSDKDYDGYVTILYTYTNPITDAEVSDTIRLLIGDAFDVNSVKCTYKNGLFELVFSKKTDDQKYGTRIDIQ